MSEINKLKVRAKNAAKSKGKILVSSQEATTLVEEITKLEKELIKQTTEQKRVSLLYEHLKSQKDKPGGNKPEGPTVVNVSGGSFD